jgi:hypothetical protein
MKVINTTTAGVHVKHEEPVSMHRKSTLKTFLFLVVWTKPYFTDNFIIV